MGAGAGLAAGGGISRVGTLVSSHSGPGFQQTAMRRGTPSSGVGGSVSVRSFSAISPALPLERVALLAQRELIERIEAPGELAPLRRKLSLFLRHFGELVGLAQQRELPAELVAHADGFHAQCVQGSALNREIVRPEPPFAVAELGRERDHAARAREGVEVEATGWSRLADKNVGLTRAQPRATDIRLASSPVLS